MSDVETALQLEKAKASQGKIPAGLSFDKLVKNQTLSVSTKLASPNMSANCSQRLAAILPE